MAHLLKDDSHFSFYRLFTNATLFLLLTFRFTLTISNTAEASQFTTNSPLNIARSGHTATLLPNARVLVVGGENDNGPLADAELYDPATGIWKLTSSMNSPRVNHTAVLLTNGTVLVVGGNNSGALASAELFDPATETWSNTPPPNVARFYHTATLLPNGQVVVAGGDDSNYHPITSAETYDPVAGAWISGPPLYASHSQHTTTLIPNDEYGILILAGGYSSNFPFSELYNLGLASKKRTLS